MKSLDSIRKYHCDIPDFLKNRPRRFIQHCIRRLPPVVDMCSQQFQEKKPGVFTFRRGKCRYLIKMSGTSLKSMLTCQCADFKRFHWPCKHLLFVIRYIDGYSWNSLPEDYKNIALFNLDSTLMANSSTSTSSRIYKTSQESSELNVILFRGHRSFPVSSPCYFPFSSP